AVVPPFFRTYNAQLMKPPLLLCGLAVTLAIVAFTQGSPQAQSPPQAQAPPAAQKAPQKKGLPPHQLTVDEKRRIEARADELAGMIQSLPAKQADETLLADVEIYESATRMILEHPEEFFSDPYVDQTLTVLDVGLERARQLAEGKSPW